MDHSRAIGDSLGKHIEDKISVNLSWKRPASVPYPNIWKRLEVKSKNGETFKVRIEDVIPIRYEEVLDFMYSNFDCQEPVSKSIDISSDSESIAARRAVRIKILDQRLSLIATLEDEQNNERNGTIIGALLLLVDSKNDTPLKVTGEKWTILQTFFDDHAVKGIDPFEILNSDIYLDDFGLAVAPEYYGLGLGFHLFSCILPVCKTLHIPGAVSMFMSSPSQSIADKLGFELYREVSYKEYRDKNGLKVFPIEGTLKYMILKISSE